jgi:dynein heavy chain
MYLHVHGCLLQVCVKVTLLNFFVTPEGLEDQLLGNVVAKERPDLAEMKIQLTLSNASMRARLKHLESQILFLLSNAQVGNIKNTHCFGWSNYI